MRFSIRTLLALMVVAALAMVAWQSRQQAIVANARAITLALNYEKLAQERYLHWPEVHEAINAELDQYDSFQDNRHLSEQTLEELVQRYGTVESRGVETLSLRTVPTIRSDIGRAPLSFRMMVPEKREVWLKFGIHPRAKSTPSDGVKGSEDHILRQTTLFESAGPFEMQLIPGEHLIVFGVVEPQRDLSAIRLTLDDQILLQASAAEGKMNSDGYSCMSAPNQVDFDSKRTLPELANYRVEWEDPEQPGSAKEFRFSIWLSQRSSSFEAFPVTEETQSR